MARSMAKCCNFNRTYIEVVALGQGASQMLTTLVWLFQISKKRAAELMLEELKKLPATPSVTLSKVKRKTVTKKKSRNLIKVGRQASIPSKKIFIYFFLVANWRTHYMYCLGIGVPALQPKQKLFL